MITEVQGEDLPCVGDGDPGVHDHVHGQPLRGAVAHVQTPGNCFSAAAVPGELRPDVDCCRQRSLGRLHVTGTVCRVPRPKCPQNRITGSVSGGVPRVRAPGERDLDDRGRRRGDVREPTDDEVPARVRCNFGPVGDASVLMEEVICYGELSKNR